MAILEWHIIQDGEVIRFGQIFHRDKRLGLSAMEGGVLSAKAGAV